MRSGWLSGCFVGACLLCSGCFTLPDRVVEDKVLSQTEQQVGVDPVSVAVTLWPDQQGWDVELWQPTAVLKTERRRQLWRGSQYVPVVVTIPLGLISCPVALVVPDLHDAHPYRRGCFRLLGFEVVRSEIYFPPEDVVVQTVQRRVVPVAGGVVRLLWNGPTPLGVEYVMASDMVQPVPLRHLAEALRAQGVPGAQVQDGSVLMEVWGPHGRVLSEPVEPALLAVFRQLVNAPVVPAPPAWPVSIRLGVLPAQGLETDQQRVWQTQWMGRLTTQGWTVIARPDLEFDVGMPRTQRAAALERFSVGRFTGATLLVVPQVVFSTTHLTATVDLLSVRTGQVMWSQTMVRPIGALSSALVALEQAVEDQLRERQSPGGGEDVASHRGGVVGRQVPWRSGDQARAGLVIN